MPYAESDDVRIYYEVFGAASDPVLVLASGGGAQLLSWDERFIAMLTDAGIRVVRFDNRDTGFSQRFGGEEDIDGGYELSDMSDDIVRVLDALGAASAHVAGHSMGGMMAQMLAIEHPERVRSIGLLSTLPGRDRRYVLHGERPELRSAPVRVTKEQAVAATEAAIRSLPPGRYDPQLEWHVNATAHAYDRGYSPDGYARQWSALLRAPERFEALKAVTVPALIFHGREDDIVHWQAAADMAAAIATSELQVHPHMGHLAPHELWPELSAALIRTVRRGEEAG
ncbi:MULTISPECIES: alpha/beta fold hydrolase [unclassified Microbacterium]|uniref:alpha/beta fold hydrolase n=1 Tax=unclassified Microbacterium TaxID=2609290 RepID=UPI00097ECB61|nr:alpha/beta hydrolase [Microbacterium sp. JB110]RCS57229.1 alpha/beta hydrolase [Microbacterium sp. JB110]SJM59172.1 alpha/beta hydrolase fold [Frigoribacterium sp. JB110]